MKRVLIVVSAFRPAMVADMQRARMLAWELPRHGWAVEVLTPRASEVRQDIIEPDGAQFFPPDIKVHETGSLCRKAFEMAGSRTHSWRTLWPIYRMGSRLLSSGRFDLVYFSTATFIYFALGSKWQSRYGVPYVLDFHDPWIKEQASQAKSSGNWKRRMAGWLSARLERAAVVHAAGLVAVSPRYIETLTRRYQDARPAWLAAERHAVIPFAARAGDFDLAGTSPTHGADTIRLVYVGAGGAIMKRAFTLICKALALLRAQGHPLVDRIRVELFGTIYDWREGEAKLLEQIAVDKGVGDLVKEHPQRVSYRRSIELLLAADGALVMGVDDAGYMPSKLFSYALSDRPLLASLRRESPAYAQLQESPGLGHALWFDAQDEMPASEVVRVVADFLKEAAARRTFDRQASLEPHLAPAMARRHAALFEACLPQN